MENKKENSQNQKEKEQKEEIEKLIQKVLGNFKKPENYAVFERLKEK